MINFDINKLNSAIAKAQKDSGAQKDNYEDRVSLGFLPEGTHKFRPFIDPNGEILRSVVAHKTDHGKVICPNWLKKTDPNGNYPDCKICELAEKVDDWRLASRTYVISYIRLIQTSSASDYWKPGTLALVSNGRFRRSFLGLLSSLQEDAPDFVISLMNPSMRGGILSMDVTRGTQGSVSITVVPGRDTDPIELGQWYKPLSGIYIPATFDKNEYKSIFVKVYEDYRSMIELAGASPAQPKPTESPSVNLKDVVPSTPKETPKPEASTSSSSSDELPWDEPSSAPSQSTTQPASESKSSAVVKLHDGSNLTLPDEVIEAGCWKKMNAADPKCVICDISVECMTESQL